MVTFWLISTSEVFSMGGYLGWVVLMYAMGPQMYPSFGKIQVPRARITNPSWPILILSQGDMEIVTMIKV
jgi:hypothetical protein